MLPLSSPLSSSPVTAAFGILPNFVLDVLQKPGRDVLSRVVSCHHLCGGPLPRPVPACRLSARGTAQHLRTLQNTRRYRATSTVTPPPVQKAATSRSSFARLRTRSTDSRSLIRASIHRHNNKQPFQTQHRISFPILPSVLRPGPRVSITASRRRLTQHSGSDRRSWRRSFAAPAAWTGKKTATWRAPTVRRPAHTRLVSAPPSFFRGGAGSNGQTVVDR